MLGHIFFFFENLAFLKFHKFSLTKYDQVFIMLKDRCYELNIYLKYHTSRMCVRHEKAVNLTTI